VKSLWSLWSGVVLGLFAVAFTAAMVWAQSLTNRDVCTDYQHQVTSFSTASPTSKLVTGTATTTIYVCAIHFNQSVAYASPSVTFYGGTGSTCGTGTSTLGAYGSNVTGLTQNVGGGMTTILNAGTGNNLCEVTTATTFANGTIEYVLK
jgi:hypothetical protein